ncbi:MAG: MlaD family protein [Chitinivibrionales bacterium]|nr:MlaD family protein [Chitinivibrionales bacterium]
MSITPSQRVRLGVFLCAGCVLVGLLIIVPVGMSFKNKFNTYYTYFTGESLSGLEEGASVKFHGVPIGKVDKISYDPRNITHVKALLKIEADFPLKTDMYAQTGDMGITGLKYVEILGGSNQAPLFKPGSEIPSRVSMFASLTGKAETIVTKIELLLNHLNAISDPDSLRSIKRILDNVAAITQDTRGFITDVRPDVKNVTTSVKNVMVKADSISGNIERLTKTVSQNITADQLVGIMLSIDSTAKSMKNLSDNVGLMVKQSREDFSVSLQNLREALETANELMQTIAENPSLLLHGEQQKERTVK